MRFTVRYIPLRKIKPDPSLKMTNHIKKLRRLMWDCMNILVVKKNSEDGSYSILTGLDRYEHLKKNEKNIYAPCIVDESKSSMLKTWLHRIRNKQPLDDYPMVPKSWSIVKSFIKQEPRFEKLSRTQQLKVLIIAVRYKKTVVSSMKKKVDQLVKKY
ncbi:hypothetical protein DS745_12045 [Anaerobacillus alkaliphilus]|uniref:ParB/Sulfiredoxin domain-containing protein n=1 Tax=Anaerobacillus alkaliphilus TaxID=1548597 RepID=A0A4Q0VUR4_9BACI|nr:hypothetical protein [Anaerobacillus alkaliphilus]RXJ00258.1 hypothetical protein DS745_12045 [Anaerobacillus alkaliphilus]